jgi:Cu2+-exporting ATPase
VFVAGFGMMQVMMYAVPVYLAGDGEMTPAVEQLMRWASLVLTLPVVLYSAAPFFRNAWRDLRLRRVGMDVPVALGVGAAFAASVWATLTAGGEVYFDSVTMFVFFLLSGRFLEMTARQRAVSVTEALARLMPVVAARMPAYPDQRDLEQVMAADLRRAMSSWSNPARRFRPMGGSSRGKAAANEALLTGESAPVRKRPGVPVTGGAVNIESPLLVEVAQVGEGTRLSAIVRLMERAAMEKPRIVELADRIASRFIICLLFLAAAVAVAWSFIDPPAGAVDHGFGTGRHLSLCAVAGYAGGADRCRRSNGARGLLVTRSHAIETLARASHFVFDKTGTLTTGEMHVLEVLPLGTLGREQSLALAAALEQASEHPIGKALRVAMAGRDMPAVEGLANEPGCGMKAQYGGRQVRVGRPDYVLKLHGRPLPDSAQLLLDGGDTVVALGDEAGWIALFRIGDEPRPEAAALVAALARRGQPGCAAEW